MSEGKHELTLRQMERERLIALHAKCPTTDRDFPYTGVLLSDGIKYCVDSFDMIRPFDEHNLKPANYKLTIGSQYAMDGQIHELSDEPGKNEITIPPFQVVVIKTRETINMPRFLIARWNIRVELAYKGLLWVGGPQVDAGFVGYLACPVYNLSNMEVKLNYGDPIAVMDFVRTSSFNEGESIVYKEVPPERFMFEDYRPKELNSALFEVATKSVKEFRDQLNRDKQATATEIKGIQTRVDNFVLITFTVIAVLFAAVTIFVARTEQGSFWNPVLYLISGTALFMSGVVWTRTSKDDKLFGRIVQIVVVAFLIGATALQLRMSNPLQNQIDSLQKEIDELHQQYKVNPLTSPIATQPAVARPPSSPAMKQPEEKKK
jgi:deoxycytidine triphosphate deaminase